MMEDVIYEEIRNIVERYNFSVYGGDTTLSAQDKVLAITVVDHILAVGKGFGLTELWPQAGGWGEIDYSLTFNYENALSARAHISFWPKHTVTGLTINMAHFDLVNKTLPYTVDTKSVIVDDWLTSQFKAITKIAKDHQLASVRTVHNPF